VIGQDNRAREDNFDFDCIWHASVDSDMDDVYYCLCQPDDKAVSGDIKRTSEKLCKDCLRIAAEIARDAKEMEK